MITNKITITDIEAKTCKLDGKVFSSSREMLHHTKKTYALTFEEYIIKAYYGGIRPTCLQTGKPLKFKARKLGPWFSDTAKNCFSRKAHSTETKEKIKAGCETASLEKYGVKNPFQADAVKEKIRQTNLERYGVDNPAKNSEVKAKALAQYYETVKENFKSGAFNAARTRSSLEIDFEEKLKKAKIPYKAPDMIRWKKYDFYIFELECLIEIDGEAFHKDRLCDLTLKNIATAVNDLEKNCLAREDGVPLHRIRWDCSENFTSLAELKEVINKCKYTPDYSIDFRQRICTKEYFKAYIYTHGKESLREYVNLFVKFIRYFAHKFPTVTSLQSFDDIKKEFNPTEVSAIYDGTKFRSQACKKSANYFLKSIFASYWGTAYKNRQTPKEAWEDITVMQKVIEYRIGCNDANEVYDFSLYELVKGLSARRITASFFNPFLASAIYLQLLGTAQTPTVLDPCCGFGGRLLGFKLAYPDGAYIGCEPNKQTYNELLELVRICNFTNVKIFNVKFEDFVLNEKVDLAFTSIPYFDIETYSEQEKTQAFNDWKSSFICAIEKIPTKTYINCSIPLANMLEWNDKLWTNIETTTSHYDTTATTKVEGIYQPSIYM